MDCSPEYIRMCEKAEEIQAQRAQYDKGDYFSCWTVGKYTIVLWGEKRKLPHEKSIWLPRQDQLQEMVKSPPVVMGNLNRLQAFMNEYSPLDGWESMEQLWLAFVMKEKYNKIWDGETWISG